MGNPHHFLLLLDLQVFKLFFEKKQMLRQTVLTVILCIKRYSKMVPFCETFFIYMICYLTATQNIKLFLALDRKNNQLKHLHEFI